MQFESCNCGESSSLYLYKNIEIERFKVFFKITQSIEKAKAMVFPVVMYGRESWTVKKAEHRRIDAFELWQ